MFNVDVRESRTMLSLFEVPDGTVILFGWMHHMCRMSISWKQNCCLMQRLSTGGELLASQVFHAAGCCRSVHGVSSLSLTCCRIVLSSKWEDKQAWLGSGSRAVLLLLHNTARLASSGD